MKSSIPVKCQCGYEMILVANGTQDPKENQCPKCGITFWFIKPLGAFVGSRILSRAFEELNRDDYTLVIVLSAMAVECELARLFFKWTDVDLMNTRMPTPADTEATEEQWRKWNSITVRLDKVSTSLTGEAFDAFLSNNPGFLAHIQTKYPTFAPAGASARDAFKEQFFHKRNKIVHRGEIDFKQPEAELCFTLAAALFQIMKDMDEKRIKAMDAKHAAHRAATTT